MARRSQEISSQQGVVVTLVMPKRICLIWYGERRLKVLKTVDGDVYNFVGIFHPIRQGRKACSTVNISLLRRKKTDGNKEIGL